MPELPEVEALSLFLNERCAGERIERCELASFAALKTFDPPLDALVGTTIRSVGRRGKYLIFGIDEFQLVIHLARGGWVKWWESLPEKKARAGSRGPLALRVGLAAEDLAPSPGFDVTEAGTEKRLAIWLVRDVNDIENVATLGPDPLEAGFDAGELGRLLARESGTVKNALVRQSVIAGVGNAYSDEALHAARLSPFKTANRLSEEEVARLHDALVSVLADAVERERGMSANSLKGDKKRSMQVHGRTGEACPVCGDVIREVSFATKSLQYCATCQTGGKPLADRRLSRLIK
ncbi:MAG TPA: DNA-formamidopyrimidine glycosylase family protein [Acidimicrobiales bacterium]|nr:DNA-formamidopyrimidine glycosylase family protein [Acidimicrobiales bacterium]